MKNQIKNTVLAAAVSATITLALPYTADARELEYPSLEQKGKFKNGCDSIARGNIVYYWKKKGLVEGSDNPYEYAVSPRFNVSLGSVAAKKFVIIKLCLPFYLAKENADEYVSRIANWMKVDDNAGLSLTLECPAGHSVAVESVTEEKNRFVFKVCSWGKKFELEFQRPLKWYIKKGKGEAIRGRVSAGDPKDAKYLYDAATGGEHGPNSVTISFEEIITVLPKDTVKKDLAYILEMAKKNLAVDPEKIHPAIRLSLPNPLSPFLSSPGVLPPTMAFAKYPFLKQYMKDANKKKLSKQTNQEDKND